MHFAMLEALRTDDEADNGIRRAEWSATDEKILTWGRKYNYLASLTLHAGSRYALSNEIQPWLSIPIRTNE